MLIWGSGNKTLLLLVVVAVTFTILSCAKRDSSDVIVKSGVISTHDFQLGDCFNEEEDSARTLGEKVYGVFAVPCAESHDNGVFAVFNLEFDAFLENDVMLELANDGCIQRFESYVGRDYWSSTLEYQNFFPTRESWNYANDRKVTCFLFDGNLRKLKGSMRGSGM